MKPLFCRHKYYDFLAAGLMSYAISFIVSSSDKIITGFFFGVEGISALAVLGPLSSLIAFFGMFIVCGLRFLYPTEVGKKNQERANQYFSCALTLAFIVCALLLVAVTAIGDAYLSLQNISGNYLTRAQEYYLFSKYIYVLAPLSSLIGAVVFTDGNPKVMRISYIFYVVTNIVLSIIFAQVFGMIGIGLGTFVSGMGSFAIQCSHFFSKKNTLRYKPYLSLRDTIAIARFGISEASFNIVSTINGVLINWFVINTFGEAYLAVNAVVGTASYLCAFFGGCQSSMVPFLNVYLGEKNRDGMLKILKVACISSIVVGIIITILVCFLAPLFPLVFSIGSEELSEVCIIGIRISSLSFVVTGLLGIITRYYNALGKNTLASVLTILKDGVIYIILFFGCSMLWGVTGMWICNLLTPLVAVPVFIFTILCAMGRDNPLNLPAIDSLINSWDFIPSPEQVVRIRDEVGVYLSEQGKTKREVNKTKFLVEEYCMTLQEHNLGKKIIVELTIIEDEEALRVIFRDSGVLEDSTGEENSDNFRGLTFSNFSQVFNSKEYMKVSGYNYKEFTTLKDTKAQRVVVGRKSTLNVANSDRTVKNWNFVPTPEDVVALRDEVSGYLSEQGKSKQEVNRAKFLVEEYCMTVLERNPGKEIVVDLTIIEDKQAMHIIFRDNGIQADGTNEESTDAFRERMLSSFSKLYESKDQLKLTDGNYKEYIVKK